MKYLRVLLLAAGIAVGCSGTQKDKVSTSAEFDHAMKSIAASTDWNSANAHADPLDANLFPAIATLRNYLSDDRVLSLGEPTRALVGTVGEHAFWAIQSTIEPRLPTRFGVYSVLTRHNVEVWIDRRQGKSLLELQIEAASISLDRAKRDDEENGQPNARDAIAVYSERLQDLRFRQLIHGCIASEQAFSDLAVMTNRRKLTSFKIYGTVPSHSDLDRFRRCLTDKGEARGVLYWDVLVRKTRESIIGVDRDS